MSEFHNILVLVGFFALVCLGVWHFLIFPFFILSQVERVLDTCSEIRIALAELVDEISEMLDDEEGD